MNRPAAQSAASHEVALHRFSATTIRISKPKYEKKHKVNAPALNNESILVKILEYIPDKNTPEFIFSLKKKSTNDLRTFSKKVNNIFKNIYIYMSLSAMEVKKVE